MQRTIDPADARQARPFSILFPGAHRDLLIASLYLTALSFGATFPFTFDYVFDLTEREPAQRGGK